MTISPLRTIQIAAVASLLSAFAVTTSVHAKTTHKLKISHSAPPSMTSELHTPAWILAKYINDNSDTMEAKVYAANQLGEERDVYEAMQLGGGADCAITGTAILDNFSKSLGVIDLPYIWEGYDNMRTTLEGPVGDTLKENLSKSGLEVMSWMTNWGTRNIVTTDKKITKPEDLHGVKIRTIQSPVYIDTINIMGANATPMSFGEVYTSMQTGVLDGFEHGSAIIQAQKFYEVAHHIALTKHFLGPVALVCSQATLGKLDDKEKQILQDGANLAADVNWALAPKREKESFDFLKEKGMEIDEVDIDAFREKVLPLQDKFAKKLGAEDLLEQIRDAQ